MTLAENYNKEEKKLVEIDEKLNEENRIRMTKEQFIEIYGQKCYDDAMTIGYDIDTSYDKNYLPPTQGCNIYDQNGNLKPEYIPNI